MNIQNFFIETSENYSRKGGLALMQIGINRKIAFILNGF